MKKTPHISLRSAVKSPLKSTSNGTVQVSANPNNIISQYKTVYDLMDTKPSAPAKTAGNTMMKKMVDRGYYAKGVIFDMFSTHDEQSGLINWISPGTKNPSKYNSPVHTAYEGFKGVVASSSAVNLNFSPHTQATLLSQNDITIIWAVGDDLQHAGYDFGNRYIQGISRSSADKHSFMCSHWSGGERWVKSSKKHFALTRNTAANFNTFVNKSKYNLTNTSSGVSTDMFVNAIGYSGPPQGFCPKNVRYIWMGSYLTDAEVRDMMDIIEEYLTSVGTGLISTPVINIAMDGHSFTTKHVTLTRLSEKIFDNVNILKSQINGVDGSTIAQMAAAGRANALDAMLSITHENYLILWNGVNDVANSAGQGTTAYNALKSYVQARLTAGWDKILVYTMTPSTYGGRGATFEAERDIFNDLIRTDITLLTGVYCLDTDTVTGLTDPNNGTYFNADKLHLTDYDGNKAAAILAIDKINTLNV